MCGLTDLDILFLRLNPVPDLFCDLVANFPLVDPLGYEGFLLLGPVESFLQPGKLVGLGIQEGEVAGDAVESLVVHGLVGVRDETVGDALIIFVEFVNDVVVLLLVFQIGVGGQLDIQGNGPELVRQYSAGVVLPQFAHVEWLSLVFSH